MLEFRNWYSIVSIIDRSFLDATWSLIVAEQCGWMLSGEHKSKLLQMDTTFLSFRSSVSYLFLFYFSISLAFLFSVCCLQQLSMEKLNEHTHIANYEAVLNGYSFNRNQLSMKLMCTHFDDLNSHCPFAPHTSHSFTLVPFYFCRTKYL